MADAYPRERSETKELARHSSPALSTHYGHVGTVDLDAALERLPQAGEKKEGVR